MRHPHTFARFLALALLVPILSACVGDKPTVALLIADTSGPLSHTVDVDAFEERVRTTCEECVVTVYDAEGDSVEQKSQVRQALAESADVVVVVPIEPEEMASAVNGEVPMISLGSLVPGSEGHVGLDGSGVPDNHRGSDLDAARDLVLGKRTSMTYVPTIAMSEQAADVSVALLADEPATGGEDVDGVQSWLYTAQDVTLDTLTTVLVGGGVLTLDDLCVGTTAKRCQQIGLR